MEALILLAIVSTAVCFALTHLAFRERCTGCSRKLSCPSHSGRGISD